MDDVLVNEMKVVLVVDGQSVWVLQDSCGLELGAFTCASGF